MRVATLQQGSDKPISEYLKRASKLSRKLPTEEIELGMSTLKGIVEVTKQQQVTFECNKSADYSFATVENLIKAAYSEIGKVNPFDPNYKDSMRVNLPGSSRLSNKELMRQVLMNTTQAFPAILQGLRNLNTATTNGIPIKASGPAPGVGQGRYPQRQIENPRVKRDLSDIECFLCHERGHYASNCPNAVKGPPPITANAVQYYEEEDGDDGDNADQAVAARCIFPVEGNPALAAAARKTAPAPRRIGQATQQASGVKKPA